MKLLAIIEAYSITGPAKNLLEFARLARPGVETTIATFTRGEPTNLFIETARASGIAVEAVEETGVYDRAVIRRLAEIAAAYQPDIVQTHAVKSHFLARCASLPRVAPWTAFHHGYTWPSFKTRLYNQLDRWSLRAAEQVLTVSIPFRQELVANGVRAERIQIIHNAIPADWGRRPPHPGLRTSLGIPEDRNVILIVGRLSREKDHLTLLEAIARLSPALRPHLIAVGDGPEKPRIEERIRALNLQASVTLTGQQKTAEPFYGIAQAAVLSSLSEGSPNALLEAMAAGVPVVATRVGGIPEIVAHEESALLIEPGDAAQMSEALSRILSDVELSRRLVQQSRERIASHHAPEARTRKLIEIYTGLRTRCR